MLTITRGFEGSFKLRIVTFIWLAKDDDLRKEDSRKKIPASVKIRVYLSKNIRCVNFILDA